MILSCLQILFEQRQDGVGLDDARCLHQLPSLPDTVAVLGADLNLEWLRAAWLQDRRIAYWGDLDTWGLLMLSRARERQPCLQPILMSHGLFDALAQTSAVVESSPADEQLPNGLTIPERESSRASGPNERAVAVRRVLAGRQDDGTPTGRIRRGTDDRRIAYCSGVSRGNIARTFTAAST